ncbi:CXXC-type zinc finger protein 1-like isoform X2 [Paramacrobiotus metropolitanus]|uniref:CXXC-type zinc finger protein 1-like isoform X2 n=1 Tax=Paramacrobiotus metropolitanus TaxID=2943436 RepID=UPI0024458483|nr:CXXC-type zinc finger protein 1-like isoform X2 [Paramacrobiotus metropolitanus]
MATVLYCVCRSAASDRFMIQCDKCEEWFHGDCVRVTQTEGNRINNYFCATCQEKDPSLKITYKATKKRSSEKKPRKSSSKKEPKRTAASPPADAAAPRPAPEAGQPGAAGGPGNGPASTSVSASDAEDDGDWEAAGAGPPAGAPRKGRASVEHNGAVAVRRPAKARSKTPKGKGSPAGSPAKPAGGRKTPAKAAAIARQSFENTKQSRNLAKKGAGKKAKAPVKAVTPPQAAVVAGAAAGAGHAEEEEGREFAGFDRKNMKQCLGPKCCFAAAPNSKYCSEECGRSLAAKRLMTIMPQRLEQFGQHTYAATLLNQKDMDGIRKKLADCKVMLEKLQARKAHLEADMRLGKRTPPAADQEAEEDAVKDTQDTSLICITCGRLVSIRTALKHFEGCSNKLENQTSYGSAFITATSSNIFCDTLNPKTMTYCKRLKVICPEHYKEAVDEHEVCGFPLTAGDEEAGGERRFCSLFKKNCPKHPSWERIKQAEIDLETLRTWIKMDELVEQERMIMVAIQSRGGIFHCMSNYTLPVRPPHPAPAAAPLPLERGEGPRERKASRGHKSPAKALKAAP